MTSISISQLKQECTKLLSDNLKTSSREISLELNQILLYVLKINNSQLLLKKTIEEKVSNIKRNLIIKNNFIFEYNSMEVEFNEKTNQTNFTMFDIYNNPNCLIEYSNIATPDESNKFKIKI